MVRISWCSCLFLIVLRLVIGWHFMFEGIYKVRTNEGGDTEFNKPFTSASYFAEVNGPLGPIMYGIIGNEDEIAMAKLTPSGNNDDKPATRMPPLVAKDWDKYAETFEKEYRLSDEDKKRVAVKLDQAKSEYVEWLTDKKPDKPEDKKKLPDDPRNDWTAVQTLTKYTIIYMPWEPMAKRIKAYKEMQEAIHDDYEKLMPDLGKDVVKIHLRTLKTATAKVRADLMKDVDEHTQKLKDSLAKIVGGRLAGFSVMPEDSRIDDRVLAMLTLKQGEAGAGQMPEVLEKEWTDYAAFTRDAGKEAPRDVKREEAVLHEAKLRYVRYLTDLDQFTGKPRPDKDVGERLGAYREQVANFSKWRGGLDAFKKDPTPFNFALASVALSLEPVRLRKTFLDDISIQTDFYKKVLGGFKDDGYRGVVPPEKEKSHFLGHEVPTTRLEWMDWSTRWGLLVAGACLFLGLFTRLACFGCIVFLVSELLSNSPLPWLPVSPKSEGNYTFVNKNTVELVALLALITLPTGRWLGLDALFSRVWPFRGRSR